MSSRIHGVGDRIIPPLKIFVSYLPDSVYVLPLHGKPPPPPTNRTFADMV